MTDKIDDGGPAFPVARQPPQTNYRNEVVVPGGVVIPGMTLRQYFAAKAMQGELAAMVDSGLAIDISDENLDQLAQHWHRIADAMIRAGAAK
jgi:hypothetical protein